MKKMIFLGWLVVFLPAMVSAQEKIDAPLWNVGDKWVFTLGNMEVVNADPNSYSVNFSNDTCILENQGFKAILFAKSNLNRVGTLEGGKRKEYTTGLRRILNFPLSIGTQWKDEYSGKKLGELLGFSESYTETFTVSGWEDLEIKAGKFRAIRLDYQQVTTNSPSRYASVPFERKSVFWYSPAAKYFIKCQYDKSYPDVIKDWEMVSFKGKKQSAFKRTRGTIKLAEIKQLT